MSSYARLGCVYLSIHAARIIYIKKLFVKDCLGNFISPKTSSVSGPASFKILLPRRTKKTLFFVLKVVYEQSEVNNGTKRRRRIFLGFFFCSL